MTDNDPAVEAFTAALRGVDDGITRLLAAYRPIIEAEVRERIAADIDAADAPGRPTDWSLDEGLTIAARIARGEQ